MNRWYMNTVNVAGGFIMFGVIMLLSVLTIWKFSKPELLTPNEWITVDFWFILPFLAIFELLIAWFGGEQ